MTKPNQVHVAPQHNECFYLHWYNYATGSPCDKCLCRGLWPKRWAPYWRRLWSCPQFFSGLVHSKSLSVYRTYALWFDKRRFSQSIWQWQLTYLPWYQCNFPWNLSTVIRQIKFLCFIFQLRTIDTHDSFSTFLTRETIFVTEWVLH